MYDAITDLGIQSLPRCVIKDVFVLDQVGKSINCVEGEREIALTDRRRKKGRNNL